MFIKLVDHEYQYGKWNFNYLPPESTLTYFNISVPHNILYADNVLYYY